MSSKRHGGRHNFPNPSLRPTNPREAGGVNIVRDLGLFCCVHMRACVDPIRGNCAGTTAPVPEQLLQLNPQSDFGSRVIPRGWFDSRRPPRKRGLAKPTAFQFPCQLPQHHWAARCAIAPFGTDLRRVGDFVCVVVHSRKRKKQARTVVRKGIGRNHPSHETTSGEEKNKSSPGVNTVRGITRALNYVLLKSFCTWQSKR